MPPPQPGRLIPLNPDFYDRDPRLVARALLGKVLIRKTPRENLSGRIVETEAYLGKNDPAAHTAAGRTARNEVLFGPPGHAYVYFIYGNHFCLNVSCLPDRVPGGVLFRALEPLTGIETMARARGLEPASSGDQDNERTKTAALKKISSGPGRMAEALGVTRARDNGKNLASPESDLWIADDGLGAGRILITPRIGIAKAADAQLRYVVAGNPFVSGPRHA